MISSFNTSGVSGKELLRIPLEPGRNTWYGSDYTWQISPEGSQIALVKTYGNQIRLAPLDGRPERIIAVRGHTDLIDMSWAADSRSLYVSSLEPGGAELLQVDLNGDAHPLWLQPQGIWIWGLASPDARHLAISTETPESNVWMISNF